MAIVSFERNFYVADNNIDAFVSEMTRPVSKKKINETTFKSQFITGEAVKRYSKGTLAKND